LDFATEYLVLGERRPLRETRLPIDYEPAFLPNPERLTASEEGTTHEDGEEIEFDYIGGKPAGHRNVFRSADWRQRATRGQRCRAGEGR
jgi:hypothetical protein